MRNIQPVYRFSIPHNRNHREVVANSEKRTVSVYSLVEGQRGELLGTYPYNPFPHYVSGIPKRNPNIPIRLSVVGSDSVDMIYVDHDQGSGVIEEACQKDLLAVLGSHRYAPSPEVKQVSNISLSYCLGLGFFYLYPELNPLSQSVKDIKDLPISDLAKISGERYPVATLGLPWDVEQRLSRGLLAYESHLWLVEKISGETEVVYLSSVVFGNDPYSETINRIRDEVEEPLPTPKETIALQLPALVDGKWVSPHVDSKTIQELLGSSNTALIPSTFHRTTAISRSVNRGPVASWTGGQYTIAGAGMFGRYPIGHDVIAELSVATPGVNPSLMITGDGWVGYWLTNDDQYIYLRSHAPTALDVDLTSTPVDLDFDVYRMDRIVADVNPTNIVGTDLWLIADLGMGMVPWTKEEFPAKVKDYLNEGQDYVIAYEDKTAAVIHTDGEPGWYVTPHAIEPGICPDNLHEDLLYALERSRDLDVSRDEIIELVNMVYGHPNI